MRKATVPRGDRQRDHQHDLAHHHHPRLHADDGAVDAASSAAQTLHYFALALTIGICFGIYSSVLVASPLVMWLGVKREQFVKAARKDRSRDEHEGAVV